MKFLLVRFSFLILTLFSFVATQAQKGREIGGWAGTSFYYGDLNTTLQIQKPGLACGIWAKRNFNSRISLRGGLNYGRIGASDANSTNSFQQGRNLSFRSHLFDFTAGIEFNFLEHIHGSADAWYTPYMIGGFSLFYFNPTTELNGQRYALRDFGTEGQALGAEYSRFSAALVLGGGIKWDISKDLSLFAELTLRKLFTDYLDDVSTVYPDLAALASSRGQIAADLSNRALVDGIGVEGRQRGNSRDNDTYVLFGIGIAKYFGQIECPKISEWK